MTLADRGGLAARQVSDPFVNLPSDQYYFNPAAFAPPADETTCAVANTTLGQYTAARAPRQVQLSLRINWN